MSNRLVGKLSIDLINLELTNLRTKVEKTLVSEDSHFERNDLINQIQGIKLNFEQVKELDTENILFYLNYNKKFAFVKFKHCEYNKRLEILNKLLKLDLTQNTTRIELADFLLWGVNYAFKDKDMAKLVKYFCNNVDYKNSNLIFEINSVYRRLYEESECRIVVEKKYQELQENRKITENL